MQLELIKIQEGFCSGNVPYHAYIKKSKKEIFEKYSSLKKKWEEKEERKKQQELNVEKKK